MTHYKLLFSFVLQLSFFLGTFAYSAPLFNNGSSNFINDGLRSDQPGMGSKNFEAADNFFLPLSQSSFSQLVWWGFYDRRGSFIDFDDIDDFTITIYEDIQGAPWAFPLTVRNVDNPLRSLSGESIQLHRNYRTEIVRYQASFDPIALAPGDQYWISIVNNTAPRGFLDWTLAVVGTSGDSWSRSLNSLVWSPVGYEPAFQIIPEPSTLLLALTAAPLLARRRTR